MNLYKFISSLFLYNLDFLVKWPRLLGLLRLSVTLTYSSSQLFCINSMLKADFGGKYLHSIWVSCNLWQLHRHDLLCILLETTHSSGLRRKLCDIPIEVLLIVAHSLLLSSQLCMLSRLSIGSSYCIESLY